MTTADLEPAPSGPYDTPADPKALARAAAALTAHGMDARVLGDAAEARGAVDALIPDDSLVYTATSRTLDVLGIADDVRHSRRFRTTRSTTELLDPVTEMTEFRRHVSSMDVVVGSVHAVTEDGQVVVASAGGSQLAPYAFGADRVVWVVGAQKVVPDLATAFDRVERHSLPLESERLQAARGIPSFIGKLLVVRRERPGRTTVLLLPEAIGF